MCGFSALRAANPHTIKQEVPIEPIEPARGVILHFEVADVIAALEHARSQGATVLMEPTHTDWGTQSAMIAGPEGIVVDFFRPLAPPH